MSKIEYDDRHDRDFIFELSKLGKVRLLSHQVTVQGNSLDFSRLPMCGKYEMEWAGKANDCEGQVSITFCLMDAATEGDAK